MTEKRKQQCRAAQARYTATPKGRATTARYAATPKGRANAGRANAKRLYAGYTYLGRVTTKAQATALNAHIKERLIGFKSGQSAGTQAESIPARPVSSEATA